MRLFAGLDALIGSRMSEANIVSRPTCHGPCSSCPPHEERLACVTRLPVSYALRRKTRARRGSDRTEGAAHAFFSCDARQIELLDVRLDGA
eukprot:745814-Hanusia_phi.AAC.4